MARVANLGSYPPNIANAVREIADYLEQHYKFSLTVKYESSSPEHENWFSVEVE